MDNKEIATDSVGVEESELEVSAEATETENTVEKVEQPKKASKKQASKSEIDVEDESAAPSSKPKKIHKGSFWCFVIIGFIAVAMVLNAIVSFFVKQQMLDSAEGALVVFKNLAYVLLTIAQLVAYSFVAIQAYYWISHRKTGWKIAYWIMVAIIFISLVIGLVTTFVDIVPKKAG